MKFWRIIIVSLFVVSLSLQSCKKEEEAASKDYMTGSLKFDFPKYVEPGYIKEYMVDTLMLASRSDGGPVGYYYSNAKGVRDTVVSADGTIIKKHFKIEVHDTLASLNLTFNAFASEKYYGSSKTTPFTIVKRGLNGENSITNFSLDMGAKIFIDDRDGKKYYYTEVDGVSWMRQNLAWEGAGTAYMGFDVMSDIFGRYYTWEEAVNACPQGWTLPSDEDWAALGKKYGDVSEIHKDLKGLAGDLMGDIYFNGSKMWEFWRDVKITDKSLLSILPAGYANKINGSYSFEELNKYAAFWTSEDHGNTAGLRYIYEDKDIVYYGKLSKNGFAASVRCVRK